MDLVTEVIDEAEHVAADLEKLVVRPGGIVDSFRREKARREAAEKERENQAEPVEQAAFKAVKVTTLAPEVFSSVTYTIAPGGNAPVLPLYPYRARAVLLVITPAATVILSKDQGVATSGVGFMLPYGIPVTLTGRGQLYALNNTAGIVQVSVIAESYAPESM